MKVIDARKHHTCRLDCVDKGVQVVMSIDGTVGIVVGNSRVNDCVTVYNLSRNQVVEYIRSAQVTPVELEVRIIK